MFPQHSHSFNVTFDVKLNKDHAFNMLGKPKISTAVLAQLGSFFPTIGISWSVTVSSGSSFHELILKLIDLNLLALDDLSVLPHHCHIPSQTLVLGILLIH